MDSLANLFGRSGLLPHGVCLAAAPCLLWLMVLADAVIAAAYFSIPLAIVRFVHLRGPGQAPGQRWLPWLFSAFIFACGTTHVLDIWTVWQPDYGLAALSKGVSAVISLVTAVLLWRLIPTALKIPGIGQLQRAINALETEVAKRKTAEQHLAETEQSLAVTLASIDAGFIAADAAGRVTRMNAVAERVTGWTQQAALGLPLWDVFNREGRPPEYMQHNPVDVMRDRGVTVDITHLVVAVTPAGQRTPVQVKAALTYSDAGQVRGLAMVFRDMTALTQAEADRDRLAAIVESSSDAIIGKTLDGIITSWNGGAQRLFGYSAAEVIVQPVLRLIPADRAAEETKILADLANNMVVPAFDTVRQTRSGQLVDVSISISPIHNPAGQIVGAAKIARDVSPQRRAEAALRDSEARLRFVLDLAQIGEWEVHLDNGAMQCSAWLDQCTGLQRPAPGSSFASFLQRLHPGDQALARHSFDAAVQARSDWQIDCRTVWPDASVHWLRLHGAVLQQAGKADRMLGIGHDITAQRQAEDARLTSQRLATENRQVLEATRLKSQFLANMSHELRTPLNAIIGFAELLQAGAVPHQSPQHAVFLGHIATSGHHLLQLINDVLDLSKVEAGKFDFSPEPIHLPRLVAEALDLLHTGIQQKHLVVDSHIDPDLNSLLLDAARLKQVLYNDLSNAIKFTPAGGRITLRALAEGPAHLRIEVQDTGIGIAEADLPRLFAEFQQLDAGYSKQHQGTGLGLALTRRLVAAQGGSTGVRSRPGQGTVFWLVLPRQPAPTGHGPNAAQPDLRWLVIEEDHHLQTSLALALTDTGWRADRANTGQQAQQQAGLLAYDGITLGLRLPDQSGLATLAGIRQSGLSRQTPVMAVSLQTAPGQAATFAVANLLRKPIDSAEVVASLAGLLQASKGPLQVLVIDDDPLACDLMHSTLRSIGAHVTCLAGGREAVQQLQAGTLPPPDAIILDLMMPDVDGFATLDALRRLPSLQHTPVFIWTSMVLTDDEYARLSRSARAVLAKGGGALADLVQTLRRWRPPARPVVPDTGAV